jgi:hypothetical protein
MAREPLNESELTALIEREIADAVDYEDAELAGHRAKALEYYEGTMSDVPPEKGKSSVVSHDIAETIGWMMPGMMRVFLGSDRIVIYEPARQGDEPFAEQATDYVNYAVMRECDGYRQLRAAIHDGFLLGNGILKHWWEDKPEYRVETFRGLSDDQFLALLNAEHVEVLEHTCFETPPSAAPQDEVGNRHPSVEAMAVEETTLGNLPPPIEAATEVDPDCRLPTADCPVIHDCKVKICTRKGRLRLKALAPEFFLVSRAATALDEENVGGFCAHRDTPTRSELIERGYDRDKVWDLPAWSEGVRDSARDARDRLFTGLGDAGRDKASERVEIFECYVRLDHDGDGITEWRQVITGRGAKARHILADEAFGDDLPFTDLVPDPVPHRWRGRSIFDELEQVQKVNTVLLRQMLNNVYLVNNPNRQVLEGAVVNMDALVNPQLGESFIVRQAGAVSDLVTPFVGDKSLLIMQHIEDIKTRRTGVSPVQMALDPEALQNQTATASNNQQSAAYSKQEYYARNIAEIGLKRLFQCLLRLICKNQDVPTTIRLRDTWVAVDPRAWDAAMDVRIDVGLGAGTRERDMAAIQAILAEQKLILQTLGDDNPICPLETYVETLRKGVEAAGIRNPEQYFGDVDEAWKARRAQAATPPADPRLELEREKVRASAQLERDKLERQAVIEDRQAASDIAVKERELAFAERLALMRFSLERQLKVLEARLKLQEHDMQRQARREAAAQRMHAAGRGTGVSA